MPINVVTTSRLERGRQMSDDRRLAGIWKA
jgi:hypothetical protein